MVSSLSSGWCSKIVNSNQAIIQDNAKLQVLHATELDGPPVKPDGRRWRLVLSDGQSYIHSILTPILNHLCDDRKATPGSTVTVLRVAWGQEGRLGRVLVILGMRYAGSPEPLIGKPTLASRSTVSIPGPSSAAQAGPSISTRKQQPAPQTPKKTVASAQMAGPAGPSTPTNQSTSVVNGNVLPQTPATPGAIDASQITPLEFLSQFSTRPVIKVGLKEKKSLQPWSNAKGSGVRLPLILHDTSGMMRATAFGDVAERLNGTLEEGSVYLFSKMQVKVADPRFLSGQAGMLEHELLFDKSTTFEKCDEPGGVPTGRFVLRDLAQLSDLENGSACDTLVYIVAAEELIAATPAVRARRKMTIIDHTTQGVRLTLWGKTAENWAHDVPILVFCRNLKVNLFGGFKQLDASGSASFQVEPNIDGVEILREWYESTGQHITANQPFAQRRDVTTVDGLRTLKEVSQQYDVDQGTVAFSSRVAVVHINPERPLTVPSCRRCRRKMIKNTATGKWRCDQCSLDVDAPSYRYWFKFKVADFTKEAYMFADDRSGPVLLGGVTAQELENKKETDEPAFLNILRKAESHQYDVTFHVSATLYNDFYRRDYAIKQITPVDYQASTRQLLNLLQPS